MSIVAPHWTLTSPAALIECVSAAVPTRFAPGTSTSDEGDIEVESVNVPGPSVTFMPSTELSIA